jgi:hypothetical protein
MTTVLYTALADLQVRSAVDSWPCPAGNTVPLNPLAPSTVALLAAGKIVLAPGGAADDTTPANVLRGVPGMKVGVSN